MSERRADADRGSPWSAADDALLTCKWHGPYKSLTTIAAEMTRECRRPITKGTIAGRVRRLKDKGLITGRPSPIPPVKYSAWSPPELATLATQRAENPCMSRSRLAAHLSILFGRTVTKSSLSNKISRAASKEQAEAPTSGTAFAAPPPAPPPLVLPLALSTRTERSEPCCFVTSDRRPWRYCDVPSTAGSAYCAEHRELTTLRLPPKASGPHTVRAGNH